MSVVDLGGTERSWDPCPVRPGRLVLVNTPSAKAIDRQNVVEGDACDPALLVGETFDLVYSNSVIEHVGGHWRRQRFADTVHRLADHHWIQTPYRYFPVEPHWVFPGFQFLSPSAKVYVMSHWPLGNYSDHDATPSEALAAVVAIELVSKAEMRHYFSGSDLLVERLYGLPKSLIAAH